MVVYYVGFPVLLLAAVIDASVLSQFRYLNGQPSLLLMLIVSWGLLNEMGDALPWALLGGIFADLMSVAPTGTSSLAYTVALFVLINMFGVIGRRNVIIPPVAAVIATGLLHGITITILALVGFTAPIGEAVVSWTLPSMIFNAIGIIFVFRIMGRILLTFRPARQTLI